MSVERRKFHRILFDAPAMITGTPEIHTKVIDISLNGLLLRRPHEWHPTIGEQLDVSVQLDSENVAVIQVNAEITHLDEEKVGFKNCNITIDGIIHLRRMLELNLADPELLERELDALG